MATTDTYTANNTWVAPTGITSVDVEVWGAGGAGGGAKTNGGTGGGGGAYSKKTLSVTPGNSYTVTVGTGGTGVSNGTGGTGGDSWFSTSGTILAKGGVGGTANGTSGGAGGASGSGIGDTKYSGGTGGGRGGSGSSYGSGGGGGGAGDAAVGGTGGSAGLGTGGSAGSGGSSGGGNGGAGLWVTSQTGNAGATIGGGGGGAHDLTATNKTGGAGARGEVRITYVALDSIVNGVVAGTGSLSGTTIVEAQPLDSGTASGVGSLSASGIIEGIPLVGSIASGSGVVATIEIGEEEVLAGTFDGVGEFNVDNIISPQAIGSMDFDGVGSFDVEDLVNHTFGYLDFNGVGTLTVEPEIEYQNVGKRFLYKIYQDGNYLTTWDKVVSQPRIRQELNGAGSELTIELGILPDTFGAEENVEYNNELRIVVADKEEPDGVVIFRGFISSYVADYDNSKVIVTVLGYGQELSQYVIEAGESAQITQTSNNTSWEFGNSGTAAHREEAGSTFRATATAKISKIELKLALTTLYATTPVNTKLELWSGATPGSGSLLGTATRVVDSSTAGIYSFSFPTAIDITSGSDYHWKCKPVTPRFPGSGKYPLIIYTSNANPLANAVLYMKPNDGAWAVQTGSDAYMVIYVSTGDTTAPFNTYDPSDILRAIIDDYHSRGGHITYTEDSIDDTGTEVSYEFNTNTTLEGVEKCLELAPENWYWYIDQANNVIHFHEKRTEPDHNFVIARNVAFLSIQRTLENVINCIYFSGGDDPALFKKYTLDDSIISYGLHSLRLKDGRVTVEETADTMANRILRATPDINLDVVIIDSNLNNLGYDLESVSVGDIIRVLNSGDGPLSKYDISLYDEAPFDYDVEGNLGSILFQVSSKEYTPDLLTVQVSTKPADITKRIQDIKRNVSDIENELNPTAPS